MGVHNFTVVPPTTAASLQSLVNALGGIPTMTTLGITRGMTMRFGQLVMSSTIGNAATIFGGGSGLTGAANASWSIVPGGSNNLGVGANQLGDLTQIYVMGNGTDKLGLQVVD